MPNLKIRYIAWPGILFGSVIFLWLATVLPRTTTELFASPDETAVMAFAKAWTPGGGFRLPHGLTADLAQLASLHPRSMVRQGEWLVPVGFLGMPFVAMLADKVASGFGAYLTALLVLSSAYPLWQLAKRSNRRVATVTVLLTLSFPTVLLYANRGLFPNLPVVALAIWSVWAWREIGSHLKSRAVSGQRSAVNAVCRPQAANLLAVLAGLTLGLALAIRPTEALWLLPWIVWAIWSGREGRTGLRPYVMAGVVTFLACLGGLWLAYQTYPSSGWLPVIGYQLRDSLLQAADSSPQAAQPTVKLPFGFHPRVMWENTRVYLLSYLAPWMAAAFFGAYLALRKSWNLQATIFLALSGWTAAVLLLVYGSAIYTDNIRGTVSLGNSFLRYLLPLVPLVAYGAARLIDAVWRLPRRGHALAVIVTAFFVFYGAAVAWAGDEEGLRNTRRELARYEAIRAKAEERLLPGPTILSARPDQIFATRPFVVVSPLPDKPTLRAILESKVPVALFHRRLTPEQVEALLDSAPGLILSLSSSWITGDVRLK